MAHPIESSTISSLQDALETKAHLPKYTLRTPPRTPDALVYGALALRAFQDKHRLVVIAADPSEITRLAQEIPWFTPEVRVSTLPDWETLPYDVLSPQESIVSERLETLYRLSSKVIEGPEVVLATTITAAQRLAPVEYVAAHTFFFKPGDRVDINTLKGHLVNAGYSNVKQVLAPGEFSVRGEIVDVFPMGSERPFRLDLFDDEIETIRWFDVDTQRSMEPVAEIRLLPGHEFPVTSEDLAQFRQRWRTVFQGDPTKSLIYRDVNQGILPPGIEYYLPLFFEATSTLSDYLSEETPLFLHGDADAALQRFFSDTNTRFRLLSGDAERPPLAPDVLWQTSEAFFTSLKKFTRFELKADTDAKLDERLRHVSVERKSQNPVSPLIDFLSTQRILNRRTLIVASSPGREHTMNELFRASGLKLPEFETLGAFTDSDAPAGITVGPLYAAASLPDMETDLLTETELYGASPRRQRARRSKHATNIEMIVRDVAELKVGDPVVHLEHGVGRYRGLETIETSEGPNEFLRLEYKNGAELFVPVTNLDMISRYSGAEPETAPLHALGRGDWEKARRKAQEQVRDTAAELLELYAVREQREGTVFPFNEHDYQAFCEGFQFEETPDQAAAIGAVLKDMQQGRPMDRLVCGDVGFGKTEVALRAAFVAANAGRQVAVLCPTTLLAEQHAQTFRDRFSAWPVVVKELSRFRTGKETTKTLEGIAEGTVDIVIGTHKLLTDKVKFKRLGLVIIDEEHRFGVRQKEQLKKLRAEVDILTLTATPIPRTLSMSLEGIRDFSVIATPPERRLSVKTFVHAESDGIIREAVIRELKRGGQVYFLHNEVDTIENRREHLEKLLPEARIGVAHGQMSERELERVMRDFYQQRFNVLLCTTIIETGIDVPSANTIIMQRADKLGLAQLHQLRGRVGRSFHQAYAYLLTPPSGAVTKQARQRLEAIQTLEDLGSGFYLAMHDLEIRGAGEVLGEHQSGEIAEVGFDLYNRMLKSAVKALRHGEPVDLSSPLASSTEINIHAPSLIPADYVADVSQRLSFYKEFASATEPSDLVATTEDLADRYGKLPEQTERLAKLHQIRLKCEALGIRKIDAGSSSVLVTFDARPRIEPLALIELLQGRRDARMMGPEKLKIEKGGATPEARTALVDEILFALSRDPVKEKAEAARRAGAAPTPARPGAAVVRKKKKS